MSKPRDYRRNMGTLDTVLEASNASANRANAFKAKDDALKARDEAIKDRDTAIRASNALRYALETARDAAQSAAKDRNYAIAALEFVRKKEREAAKLIIELRAARDTAKKGESIATRERDEALAKLKSVTTTDKRNLEKVCTERDAAIVEKEVATRQRDRAIAELESCKRKQSSVVTTESVDKDWCKQALKALRTDNEQLQNELFLRGEELQDKDSQAVEEMQKAQEIINVARAQAAKAREEADLVAQSHAGIISRVKSLLDEHADVTGRGYSRFAHAFDELRLLIAEIPKTMWVELQETRDADDEDHRSEDEGEEETEGSSFEDFDPERVTRQLEREQRAGESNSNPCSTDPVLTRFRPMKSVASARYQAATQKQNSKRTNPIAIKGYSGRIRQEAIHLEDDLDSSNDTIHIRSKIVDIATPTRAQAINKKQPIFVDLSDTDDEGDKIPAPQSQPGSKGTSFKLSDKDYEDDLWSDDCNGALRPVKRARVC